jgi:hypothetical protein
VKTGARTSALVNKKKILQWSLARAGLGVRVRVGMSDTVGSGEVGKRAGVGVGAGGLVGIFLLELSLRIVGGQVGARTLVERLAEGCKARQRYSWVIGNQ